MRIDRIKLIAEMARAEMKGCELAEKAGVNRVTVSAVRRGKSCTEETAAKLAAGLGVPLDRILEE